MMTSVSTFHHDVDVDVDRVYERKLQSLYGRIMYNHFTI